MDMLSEALICWFLSEFEIYLMAPSKAIDLSRWVQEHRTRVDQYNILVVNNHSSTCPRDI